MPAWMIYGFAVFSMFFGSGNLVFPINIGVESAAPWISILGLLISAILIPMMGLMGVLISGQGIRDYLSPLGKKTAFCLIVMMLLLLGPFGVLPRSLMVASGGMSLVFGKIPLPIIGLGMVLMGHSLALSQNMIRWIGQYFTPLILLGLFAIIAGICFLPLSINHAHSGQFWDAFSTGFQTMDLIAALFFARALSSAFIKQYPTTHHSQILWAASFGFFCLLVVYSLMVLVSYQLSDQLQEVASEKRIVTISSLILGDHAKIVSGFVIASACMTTYAVLLKEFIQFFSEYCPRWSMHQLAFVVSVISYMGSFMGFDQLAAVIGFILHIVYPALILFVVLRHFDLLQRAMYAGVFYVCIALNMMTLFIY
ncbi:branched-chain amino acid transport system II carrier protein [Gammaproteobacteria bacterium]|nr:branched-chain amino acid transport system II carrier protein [Gammaproteobacteria bacterium]